MNHLGRHILRGVKAILILLFGWDFLISYKTLILRGVLLILQLGLVVFVHDIILGFRLVNLTVLHTAQVLSTDFLCAMNGHSRCTLTI